MNGIINFLSSVTPIFTRLINMSITAGYITIAVILIRLILSKAPKWIRSVLWSFVALRLVLPFSFESIFSLIPSSETIPEGMLTSTNPQISSGIGAVDSFVNPIIPSIVPSTPSGTVSGPKPELPEILSLVWLVGVIIMLVYVLVSFLRVRHSVREAVKINGNILICDKLPSPFILGIIRPKIYLPSSMSDREKELVTAHEKAHLHRLDHVWKPLGFLLLSVYWFNPLMWVAYILLCRDIELACDEKVLLDMGEEAKKEYSSVLLSCSAPRRLISACPLAFGEVGVKQRIKNVLSYKKPAFWIIILALAVCITASVCLLTNPKSTTLHDKQPYISDSYGELLQCYVGDYGAYDKITLPSKEMISSLMGISVNGGELSSEDLDGRTMTHTIILQKQSHIDELIPTDSFLRGIYIDFNRDFTDVLIKDGDSVSALYRVKDPSKAKEIYESFLGYCVTEVDPKLSIIGISSEDEKVRIDVLSLRRENDNLMLEIRWNNHSDEIISYGMPFGIQKQEGGQWTNVGGSNVWALPAFSVHPLTTANAEFREMNREYTYNITEHFRVGENGTYRFSTSFSFDSDKSISYKVYVDFTIEYYESTQLIYTSDYISGNVGGKPMYMMASLSFDAEKKQFSMTDSLISSYIFLGSYSEENGKIVCKTADSKFTLYFKREGNEIIYESSNASTFLPKGAIFTPGSSSPPAKADIDNVPDYISNTLTKYGIPFTVTEAESGIFDTEVCHFNISDTYSISVFKFESPTDAYINVKNVEPGGTSIKFEQGGKTVVKQYNFTSRPSWYIWNKYIILYVGRSSEIFLALNCYQLHTSSLVGYKRPVDQLEFDIDGDGENETCTLTHGDTSGTESVILTVSKNGTDLYRSEYIAPPMKLREFVIKDGKLKVMGTAYNAKENRSEEYLCDIGIQGRGVAIVWSEELLEIHPLRPIYTVR